MKKQNSRRPKIKSNRMEEFQGGGRFNAAMPGVLQTVGGGILTAAGIIGTPFTAGMSTPLIAAGAGMMAKGASATKSSLDTFDQTKSNESAFNQQQAQQQAEQNRISSYGFNPYNPQMMARYGGRMPRYTDGGVEPNAMVQGGEIFTTDGEVPQAISGGSFEEVSKNPYGKPSWRSVGLPNDGMAANLPPGTVIAGDTPDYSQTTKNSKGKLYKHTFARITKQEKTLEKALENGQSETAKLGLKFLAGRKERETNEMMAIIDKKAEKAYGRFYAKYGGRIPKYQMGDTTPDDVQYKPPFTFKPLTEREFLDRNDNYIRNSQKNKFPVNQPTIQGNQQENYLIPSEEERAEDIASEDRSINQTKSLPTNPNDNIANNTQQQYRPKYNPYDQQQFDVTKPQNQFKNITQQPTQQQIVPNKYQKSLSDFNISDDGSMVDRGVQKSVFSGSSGAPAGLTPPQGAPGMDGWGYGQIAAGALGTAIQFGMNKKPSTDYAFQPYKPQYLDPRAEIIASQQESAAGRREWREKAGGNQGAYLAGIGANVGQGQRNTSAIISRYANANVGIGNQSAQNIADMQNQTMVAKQQDLGNWQTGRLGIAKEGMDDVQSAFKDKRMYDAQKMYAGMTAPEGWQWDWSKGTPQLIKKTVTG